MSFLGLSAGSANTADAAAARSAGARAVRGYGEFDGPGFANHLPAAGKRSPSLALPSRKNAILCGSRECTRSWKRPWKDFRRPVFNGAWGCSRACVLAMVERAVRRAGGDRSAGTLAEVGAVAHRHRVPLGLVLLAQGWITHQQLQLALRLQQRTGTGRIGELLVEHFAVPEDRITRALSVQWSCPVLNTEGFQPLSMALTMPRLLVEWLSVVPLRIAAESILYLGFADQCDASIAAAMQHMTGLRVESGLVGSSLLAAARSSLLACDFIDATTTKVAHAEALSAKIAEDILRLQPMASRLVRVHGIYWLRLWLEGVAVEGGAGTVPVTREDIVDCLYLVQSGEGAHATA